MTIPDMEKAIRELQDAAVIMAHLEKAQSERILAHAQELSEVREFQRRTEMNLAEITDKLNGLIGYIDDQRRK